jgi:hypothetical protein
MPAPQWAKWAVLSRYGDPQGTWIETGTYLGDTTAYLARQAKDVYSIEPEPALAQAARRRLSSYSNVTVIHETSEVALPKVLALVQGPLSLWLDGHYSGGPTFRGALDTPISQELDSVQEHLKRLERISVLVDDWRCFDPSRPGFDSYPKRQSLVDFAERNELAWTIELDIFAAWR